MVFAHTEYADVSHQYHFVMTFVKDRAVEEFFEGLTVTAGEKPHCFCYPLWGFEQSFAFGVFSYSQQNCPNGGHHFFLAYF